MADGEAARAEGQQVVGKLRAAGAVDPAALQAIEQALAPAMAMLPGKGAGGMEIDHETKPQGPAPSQATTPSEGAPRPETSNGQDGKSTEIPSLQPAEQQPPVDWQAVAAFLAASADDGRECLDDLRTQVQQIRKVGRAGPY